LCLPIELQEILIVRKVLIHITKKNIEWTDDDILCTILGNVHLSIAVFENVKQFVRTSQPLLKTRETSEENLEFDNKA